MPAARQPHWPSPAAALLGALPLPTLPSVECQIGNAENQAVDDNVLSQYAQNGALTDVYHFGQFARAMPAARVALTLQSFPSFRTFHLLANNCGRITRADHPNALQYPSFHSLHCAACLIYIPENTNGAKSLGRYKG